MGRFNTKGEYLTGVAGGALAIDGKQIGVGSGRWLDDDTVLANSLVDAWRLYAFDRSRGWRPRLVDGRGATSIAAGGMNWAASLASPGLPCYGVFNGESLGQLVTGGRLLVDVAYALDGYIDGTLLFVRHADYGAIIALWPDGAIDTFNTPPGTRFDSVRAIAGGFCYSVEQGGTLKMRVQYRTYAAVDIPTIGPAFEPYAFVDGDGLTWVLYHNDRIYLHAAGSPMGHVFEPGFHPDVWPAGVRVGYAHNEEGLDAIVLTDYFKLSENLQPLAPPAPPPVVVPAVGRPLWLAFYTFGEGGKAPHNATLVVGPDMAVRTLDGTKVYTYVAGFPDSDVDALEAAIHEAKKRDPKTPVLAYWTRKAQAVRVPRGADVVGVEMYWHADETLADFEDAADAAIIRCQRVAEVVQCYTSNPGNNTNLAPIVAVAARRAKARKVVEATIVFSDGVGRGTGYLAHPEVWPAWAQFAAGISTPMIVVPPPVVIPPVVHPPAPTPAPTEETDMPIAIGQKGMYRPIDSTVAWTRAEVVKHQDAGFLGLKKENGKIVHFDPANGKEDGERDGTPGGEERVTFDGRNIMLSRAGDLGRVGIFAWINL